MSLNYTLAELVETVRELAHENPDFVYRRKSYDNYTSVCVYTEPDGTPSCIIGQALSRLGDPVPAWDSRKKFYSASDREIAMIGTRAWVEYFGRAAEDHHSLAWLGAVQSYQDMGMGWAEAVESTDREINFID